MLNLICNVIYDHNYMLYVYSTLHNFHHNCYDALMINEIWKHEQDKNITIQ